MHESLSAPSDEEQILADFVAQLEKRGPGIVEEFVGRYPALADEFRGLAAMGDLIHQTHSDADPPMPERLGEFKIVRRIGRGGMGEIYEAFQDRLKRRVAVKVIRQGKISPDSRARFLREQTILARLHQTHIVPIHTAGEHGPLHYFAMPYIEGATLSETIQAAREQQTSNPGGRTPPLGDIAGKLAADSRQRARAAQPPAPTLASPLPPPASTSDATFSPLSPGGRGDGGEGANLARQANDTPPSDNNAPVSTTHHSPLTTHLSMDYFRSAAQVLADAAMALHHAHGVQILHRDVKPSNIMVDKFGQCWIIDFGLAGYVKGEREPIPNAETMDFEPEPITSAHIKGTPQYMAPEQFEGQSDVRTDVWGLGVTLYELCTLRRAFEGRGQHEISRKIQSEEPPSPRQLVPNLPADLAAICRKAIHKDSARRYPTAEDFSADLNRWLRHEPVHARPTNAVRRAWLWSKRNKGWAAAITVAMVAFVTFALGMIVYQEKMTDAAQQRAADAEAHELEQKGLALLRRLEGVRIGPHTVANDEWWSESWAIVKETAPLRPRDQELRDQAAATLSGIDARLSKEFDFGGSSVALSPDGNRMLIGGTAASIDNRHQAEGAKVWDCASGHVVYKSSQLGPGPVGFARDETPLHLLAKDHSTLLLWDVAKNRNIREFRIAPGHQPEPLHQFNAPRMAMTPAGTLIAASPALPEDGKLLVIWEVATGEKLRSFPERATALAFSRDGKYLAAGNKNGQVKIWTVQDGYEAATLPAVLTVVRSLAFDPDGRSLAVGDSAGNIFIWDLERKGPRVICRGSGHDIYILAFTQDGTMLASAGRSHIRLWDGATGRELLELGSNNPVTGLAFAPDGNRLAMTDEHTFGPRHCSLWELQHGRGIRTLRGLSAPISRVCFSSNGRLLAGLSHDWQLGIWELPSGRLRRLLKVQPGITADNAGLAFSPDGKRFAFAAGRSANLWDLDSGDALGSWKLENGQIDSLAFDSEGKKLRLFRMEGPAKPPFVCRILELLPHANTPKILCEINDFNADVSESVAAPDGSYFIAAGVKDPNGVGAITKMFDASSGRGRMVLSSGGPKATAAVLALDSTGRILSIGYNAGENTEHVVDVKSGTNQSGYWDRPESLGPGGQLWGRRAPGERGFLLYRRGETRPVVTLGIDSHISSVVWPFSRDGKYLAWGNTDGSVTVCDLEEVRQRLNKVGLGW